MAGPDAQSFNNEVDTYNGPEITVVEVPGVKCKQFSPAELKENLGLSPELAEDVVAGFSGGGCPDLHLKTANGVSTSKIEFPGEGPVTVLYLKGGRIKFLQGEIAAHLNINEEGEGPSAEVTYLNVRLEGGADANIISAKLEQGDLLGAAQLLRIQVSKGEGELSDVITGDEFLIAHCAEQILLDPATQEILDIFMKPGLEAQCAEEGEQSKMEYAALSPGGADAGQSVDAGSEADVVLIGEIMGDVSRDANSTADTHAYIGADSGGGCSAAPYGGTGAPIDALGAIVGLSYILANTPRATRAIMASRFLARAFGIIPEGTRVLFQLLASTLVSGKK